MGWVLFRLGFSLWLLVFLVVFSLVGVTTGFGLWWVLVSCLVWVLVGLGLVLSSWLLGLGVGSHSWGWVVVGVCLGWSGLVVGAVLGLFEVIACCGLWWVSVG